MRGSASSLILLVIGFLAVAPPAANAFSGLSGVMNFLQSSRRSTVIPCDMATVAGVASRRAPSRPKAAKSADAQHTVTELKSMLRSRGLPTSGRKAQLVKRLEVTVQGAGFAPAPKGTKAPKFSGKAIEESRKKLQDAMRSNDKASSWTHATSTAFLEDLQKQYRGSSSTPSSWTLSPTREEASRRTEPTEASKKDEDKKKEKERREAAAQAEAARRAEEEKTKKESAARLAAPEATEMDEERRMELKARIAEVAPPHLTPETPNRKPTTPPTLNSMSQT